MLQKQSLSLCIGTVSHLSMVAVLTQGNSKPQEGVPSVTWSSGINSVTFHSCSMWWWGAEGREPRSHSARGSASPGSGTTKGRVPQSLCFVWGTGLESWLFLLFVRFWVLPGSAQRVPAVWEWNPTPWVVSQNSTSGSTHWRLGDLGQTFAPQLPLWGDGTSCGWLIGGAQPSWCPDPFP